VFILQGVAAANPEAYLTDICSASTAYVSLVSALDLTATMVDRQVLKAAAAVNDTPMWVGEWALSTNFNATDDFMKKWADAQKLAYSQGAGWLVCSFYLCDNLAQTQYLSTS
jgi:hypothetical protein